MQAQRHVHSLFTSNEVVDAKGRALLPEVEYVQRSEIR
jgi:hypothetical protein